LITKQVDYIKDHLEEFHSAAIAAYNMGVKAKASAHPNNLDKYIGERCCDYKTLEKLKEDFEANRKSN
jgi:hypothetical protein